MDTKNVTTGTENRNQILEAQAAMIDAILDLPASQRSRAILEHTRQLKATSRVRVQAQLLAARAQVEDSPEVAAARARLLAFGFVWTPATTPPTAAEVEQAKLRLLAHGIVWDSASQYA